MFSNMLYQVYKSVADKFDYDYAKDTDLGYVAIALTNWDHFGIVGCLAHV